jgi:AraC-like DNA-binding protein/mannose-6-phosphate isomerase-like protein (cupin superfamily)
MPHKVLKSKDWFHPDGFPVAVERRTPQEPFGLHAHEFAEVVLITSGRGIHVTGTESYPLSAGDVFVIGGSRPHDYHSMDRLCLINVLFQPKKLQWNTDDLTHLPGYHALFTLEPAWRKRHQFRSRLRLNPTELGHATGYIDDLERELLHRKSGFRFMAMASFMALVGYLSRCYNNSPGADSVALLRIGRAISHLEIHFEDSDITVDALAGMAHMSKRSFMRTFQAATGMSPIAYLIQLRINRAAQLLRSRPEMSITEIALETGFSDSNYFARQFRLSQNITPTGYRFQRRGIRLREER